MVFEKIEGSVVIIAKKGVYSQHEAWIRKDEVFCKVGSGFLGMRRNGTSVIGIQLVDYDLGEYFKYAFTDTGRMVVADHPNAEESAKFNTEKKKRRA